MITNDKGDINEGHELESRLNRLRANIARWTGKKKAVMTEIPGLYFFRREETSGPETVFYEPSLCVLAQGAKRVYPGGGSFVYDANHFMVAAVDMPTVVEVIKASPEEPSLGVVIDIDHSEVSQLILDSKLPATKPQPSGLGIESGELTAPLLDAVCRLVDLLDQPRDIPVMAPNIRREILYRLLLSDQGVRLRQIVSTGNQSHQISQTIAWLKENMEQPVKVDDLAARANMSPSSFHHHFRALTARSPLQYLKWLRLNKARQLMLIEQLDVSNAAYRVGYGSSSQFNREYSRLFGLPPARDIRQLRQRITAE